MPELHCAWCGHSPEQTHGVFADMQGMSAEDYVRQEEGTLDDTSGQYLCDTCYVDLGQPVGYGGRRWTATPSAMRALTG